MEGFENGLPNQSYLEGAPASNHSNIYSTAFRDGTGGYPQYCKLATGRNAYSLKALEIDAFANMNFNITPTTEMYLRFYAKFTASTTSSTCTFLMIKDTGGSTLVSILGNGSAGTMQVKVYKAGALTQVYTHSGLSTATWYKFEMYLKIDASTGAYNFRIDDVSYVSESGLNTGAVSIQTFVIGNTVNSSNGYMTVDDIAVNDTAGAANNSWCGAGTIVGLKPKAAGASSEWTSSQGWAVAEASSDATTINLTGHGLATNDVMYNVTRDAYRIVTRVNDNQFTVSSVTNQAAGDIVVLFTNVASIAAGVGTSTSKVVLAGHTLESYDVFVNTSRSNAIRKALYIDGTSVYNYYSNSYEATIGATVTSQASGDTIKTFKVHPYAISDHYKAVYSSSPNPNYSNIQSGTAGHIDTFDMQELVADLEVPADAGIIAVSHNIYAKEKGAGSQIKPVFRIDGTEYSGDAISLVSGTKEYQQIYEENPATDAAWDIAEIDALEAGVEVA